MSEEPEQVSEKDEPHDVLAAEEFGVPAPDPILADEPPVPVPEDPGDPEGHEPPHDVLAGEEFPIPGGAAGPGGAEPGSEGASGGSVGPRLKAGAGVLGGVVAIGVGLVLKLRKRGEPPAPDASHEEDASEAEA